MNIGSMFKKDKNKAIKEIDVEQEEITITAEWFVKFKEAVVAKQPYVDMWNKCLDAYNSEYFINQDKPEYKSDEISNFIFSTIETIKPIMVDNDPKIMTLPKTPDGMQVVDKLQNLLESEWSRAKMSGKLNNAVSIALQIGTCPIGMFWDGKDENGLGNVNPKIINPYNLFPDPMATCMDDAEYMMYATYKQVNKLKQTYPALRDRIVGSQVNYGDLISRGQDSAGVTNQVLVLEIYTRDYTSVDYEDNEEVVNNDGVKSKKKVTKQKRKYPNGKILTIAPELNIVLDEKANPYKDGQFPFHMFKCYDIPFEFWGKGEIEQLLSPQTYINELTNQIIDNAKLTANVQWIIDKNSGIGKGQLTNRPGLIVRKNPGTSVERRQPPAIPAYIQEMIMTLKQDIEIISGVHDVTQGRKPGSVSAASAIIALQEAAQARIRLKVKMMEQTLTDIGNTWYKRIQQFWVTSRYVRYFDKENNVQFTEITSGDLEAEIDFVIVGGSTMPMNKNAMLDLMIRLAQTPAEDGFPMVDRETVLTYTNVPDKQKIIQKFTELSGMAKEEQNNQALAQQEAEMAKMQQQAMLEQQTAQVSAEAQQKALQNGQITDEQLQVILEMLMANPDMLNQLDPSLGQNLSEGFPTIDDIEAEVL